MNDKDLDIVEKHKAKMHLGLQKSLNKALNILEMIPKERAKKEQELEEMIRKREERKKRI